MVRYSLNAPVSGSSRPSVFAICPVYQSEPSAAASGSYGCEPFVGTGHSIKDTLTCASAAGSRSPARIGTPSNSSAAIAADRNDFYFNMGHPRADMVNEMLNGAGNGASQRCRHHCAPLCSLRRIEPQSFRRCHLQNVGGELPNGKLGGRECVGDQRRERGPSHSGPSVARSPGIHNFDPRIWIRGSRPTAAPRNDA